MTEKEEWRSLNHRPGGYSVSNLGRVRRDPLTDARGWARGEVLLTPFYRFRKRAPHTTSRIGIVRLVTESGTTNVPVPQLVAEAYLPYEKTLHEIEVRDGNHANWALSNIRLRSRIADKLEKELAQFVRQSVPSEAVESRAQ